ncbi:MAG TPA: segregation/condensation protein A [Armatimonadota bacterium]|jgi:segregation and condensation protein A
MSTETQLQLAYTVKLPAFEGPLDLLLHLIREHKIDIYDIPIAEITDQYLTYLSLMESLDLNVAGEFFVMAATLLEIKSRLLLPLPPKDEESEEGFDPRADLVEKLLEYEKFKNMASSLKAMEDDRNHIYWRLSDDLKDYDAPVIPLNLQALDLLLALRQMLSEVGEGEQEVTSIERQKMSLRMKMREIWGRIKTATAEGRKMGFRDLLATPFDKVEIVMTFLALLELLRLQKIKISQKKALADIAISAVIEKSA